MTESIIDYIPDGIELRPNQVESLLYAEKHWDELEVLVVDAPTGSGKSIIAGIIGLWRAAQNERTGIITPNIQQQAQLQETFPRFPSLRGKSRYTCTTSSGQRSCKDTFDMLGGIGYCAGCPYRESRNGCLSDPVSIYNYYSFFTLRNNPIDVVIVDEGHNLVDMVVDLNQIVFSAARYGIPNGLGPRGDFLMWIEEAQEYWSTIDRDTYSAVELKSIDTRLKKLNHFLNIHYLYHLQIEADADGLEKIVAVPRSGIGMSAVPWRRDQKIIIMSATFGERDLARLNLTQRNWAIKTTASPIPPQNRPVTYYPAFENTFNNRKAKLDPALEAGVRKILDYYPDVKGIVHIPYGDQALYKAAFKGGRFKFHSKKNKLDVFRRFRASNTAEVLFASGMAEGIDLPYDAARFQIIPKILWANITDSYIKDLVKKDPEWYTWLTMRTTLQQVGRICRAPDDWGATFILDSTFSRLLFSRGDVKLPKYFIDSLSSSATELVLPKMETLNDTKEKPPTDARTQVQS